MAGYPGHNDYNDGYGHHQSGNTDSYYQDDQQYYDSNGYDAHGNPHGGDGYGAHGGHHQGDGYGGQHGGDGYYDES